VGRKIEGRNGVGGLAVGWVVLGEELEHNTWTCSCLSSGLCDAIQVYIFTVVLAAHSLTRVDDWIHAKTPTRPISCTPYRMFRICASHPCVFIKACCLSTSRQRSSPEPSTCRGTHPTHSRYTAQPRRATVGSSSPLRPCYPACL